VRALPLSAVLGAPPRAAPPPGAEFVVGDARDLDHDGEFDLVLSACQGAFGLLGAEEQDGPVFDRMARAVRPGGHLVVDTFNAAFALRHLEAGEEYDVGRGVLHETAIVRGPSGDERPFDLWTTCWTPRELRLLAERSGLAVVGVHASAPGRWRSGPPAIDEPGVLLVARRPALV
jgi:SAM-dependent methyltransferase